MKFKLKGSIFSNHKVINTDSRKLEMYLVIVLCVKLVIIFFKFTFINCVYKSLVMFTSSTISSLFHEAVSLIYL